jgi:hypothetical protein
MRCSTSTTGTAFAVPEGVHEVLAAARSAGAPPRAAKEHGEDVVWAVAGAAVLAHAVLAVLVVHLWLRNVQYHMCSGRHGAATAASAAAQRAFELAASRGSAHAV